MQHNHLKTSAIRDGTGFLRCGLRTLWSKKIWIFPNYGVSARTRRVEPVRTFCRQKGRGGVNFSRFYAVIFYERLLIRLIFCTSKIVGDYRKRVKVSLNKSFS